MPVPTRVPTYVIEVGTWSGDFVAHSSHLLAENRLCCPLRTAKFLCKASSDGSGNSSGLVVGGVFLFPSNRRPCIRHANNAKTGCST